MKKVSTRDIATSLDVSKSLDSFVLNGLEDEKMINLETQSRVQAKACELNFNPNLIARGMHLGKSKTIGLIVPDISIKFYAKLSEFV